MVLADLGARVIKIEKSSTGALDENDRVCEEEVAVRELQITKRSVLNTGLMSGCIEAVG